MTNLPSIFQDFDTPFSAYGFGSWRPLLRQLDSLMSGALGQGAGEEGSFVPACDISETDDSYLLSFDMPGIDKSQIDIEVLGNQLIVRGERKFERDEGKGRSRTIERRQGSFVRAVTLPGGIKPEEIQATYDNGVLNVMVAKPAEAKVQKIKIGEGKAARPEIRAKKVGDASASAADAGH